MKVAVVQMCPVFQDVRANIAQMEELVSQAAEGGADLVVLPELAVTGYSFMSKKDASVVAEVRGEGLSFEAMRQASLELGVALVWGLVEKSGGNLYNAQCMVTPDGRVAGYQKRNLWANDHIWATQGNESPPVLNWKGRRIGLLICRDIRNERGGEPFYEEGDADVIAFSSNFGDGAFPASAWMSFVKNNRISLAVSNRYGQEANNNFGEGGVCVIHPDGHVVCKGLKWSAPCIVYDDV